MFSNDLVTLRVPSSDDVDRLYIWENDSLEATSAPVSRQMVWEFVNGYTADIFAQKQLRMMIVDRSDGATVGHVDLYDFDPRASRAAVGIYVVEERRCRGLARASLSLISDYARRVVNIHQLWALVAVDNKPSRALFSGAGFRPSGRLRSWLRSGSVYTDAIIFQLLFP